MPPTTRLQRRAQQSDTDVGHVRFPSILTQRPQPDNVTPSPPPPKVVIDLSHIPDTPPPTSAVGAPGAIRSTQDNGMHVYIQKRVSELYPRHWKQVMSERSDVLDLTKKGKKQRSQETPRPETTVTTSDSDSDRIIIKKRRHLPRPLKPQTRPISIDNLIKEHRAKQGYANTRVVRRAKPSSNAESMPEASGSNTLHAEGAAVGASGSLSGSKTPAMQRPKHICRPTFKAKHMFID